MDERSGDRASTGRTSDSSIKTTSTGTTSTETTEPVGDDRASTPDRDVHDELLGTLAEVED